MSTAILQSCMLIGLLLPTAVKAERPPVAAPRPVRPYAQSQIDFLDRMGVSTDPEQMRQWLRKLTTPQLREKQVIALSWQLGGRATWRQREAAMIALRRMPRTHLVCLEKTLHQGDLERERRLKRVLDTSESLSRRTLVCILGVIERRALPGMTAELLAVLGEDATWIPIWTVERAAFDGCSESDVELIRTAMRSPASRVRGTAARLAALMPVSQLSKELLEMTSDAEENVQLAAIHTRLLHADRTALKSLVALLEANDPAVRSDALTVLYELTGETYGLSTTADRDDQLEPLIRWKNWLENHSQSVALDVLKPLYSTEASLLRGNTLLACGYSNYIAELDPSGNEVFRFKAEGAWCAEKLRNGNYLVSAHTENRVFQVDPGGKIVWEYKVRYPIAARAISHDRYLITCYQPGRLLEIDRSGKILWEHKLPKSAYDGHKLLNGNVMFTSGNEVAELDRNKKIVWKYGTKAPPYGIYPMRNGHVLICESGGRVIEVTRDKQIVWEFKTENPSDAFRLGNGNTLISGSTGFKEVTPDGNVIWTKKGARYGSIRR